MNLDFTSIIIAAWRYTIGARWCSFAFWIVSPAIKMERDPSVFWGIKVSEEFLRVFLVQLYLLFHFFKSVYLKRRREMSGAGENAV